MDLANLTDQEVAKALADQAPDNPVARAVAAAIESYALALQRQADRAGGWPTVLHIAEPGNAIERAAGGRRRIGHSRCDG
jgi:hypothetical protein